MLLPRSRSLASSLRTPLSRLPPAYQPPSSLTSPTLALCTPETALSPPETDLCRVGELFSRPLVYRGSQQTGFPYLDLRLKVCPGPWIARQQVVPSAMGALSAAASLQACHQPHAGLGFLNSSRATSGTQVPSLKILPRLALASCRNPQNAARLSSSARVSATWQSAAAEEPAGSVDGQNGTESQESTNAALLANAGNATADDSGLSQAQLRNSSAAGLSNSAADVHAAISAELVAEVPLATAPLPEAAPNAADSPMEAAGAAGDVADGTEEEASMGMEARPAGTPRRRRMRRPDLLLVPGVGPRTLLKLRASGIDEVAALTQVYREKTRRDSGEQAMVDYLRRDVGVRKDHATLISTFLKHRVDLEEGSSKEGDDSEAAGKEQQGPRRPKRLTFCVEGNISVGKSTFLRRVAGELLKLHEFVEIVPEPVDKWQDVGGAHLNLLQEFYDDPRKHAYTFQNYVFVTRVMQSLNTREGPQPLRLMERSIFSDRMVFVRAVHEAQWLDDLQLNVYDSSFDPFVRELPGLVPDGFIYLRADPATCYQRLQMRGREEESKVTFEYLNNLHNKHDTWLIPPDLRNVVFPRVGQMEGGLLINGAGERRLRIDEKWPGETAVPARLRDKVFGLRGAEVHPSIQNVPALVLDCNHHIDFNIPPEEMSWYADDILAFFDFVKGMKEEPSLETVNASSSRLILPGQCLTQHQQLFNSIHASV